MATQTFTDFEAFVGAVRDAEGRFMLTHPLERKWVYTHRPLNRVSLQCGHEESGAVFEGTARRGGCILFVGTSVPPAHTANGERVHADSLTVLGPRADACFATRGRSDWFSIYIPCYLLSESAELYHFDADACATSLRKLRPSRERLARLRALVNRLEDADRRTPWLFDDPTVVAATESELLAAALSCLDPTTASATAPHGAPRRAARDGVVRAALSHFDAASDAHRRMGDIAEAADVSERTLRSAFSDYFGVSPARYLKLRQLHEVRRALARATAVESTVTEIEGRLGVSEFGRFAHDYRALFGELPSETLNVRARPGRCHANGAANPAVLTENSATATLATSARRSGRSAECAGLENR